MLYMNDYDIEMASRRFTTGVKAKAVKILQAHVEVVNANSDGWAYWKPPVVAAKRLMELIQSPTHSVMVKGETVVGLDEKALKQALSPIKAFYTKHPQLPRPNLDGSAFTLKSLEQTAREIEAERLTREGLAP